MTLTPSAPSSLSDVDRARLLDVLDARSPGRPLPGAAYTDEALHRLDLELIWQRQWVFVGSVAEVREPGDYVTVELGTVSVLVLRDDDEQVAAFRNVCRHRGARLVEGPRGSVGNIVCGYHRWTYGTDGLLRHAPQLAAGTDTSCLGLRRVAVRVVGGLVFVCLAADPPRDVDAVAEVVEPYLTPHALDRTKVAAQVDLVEDGNWKLTMENNRECYHCEGHPDLLRTFFPTWGLEDHQVPPRLRAAHDRYLLAEADLALACDERGIPHRLVEDLVDRPLGFRIAREALDGLGESFSRDGSRLVRRLLGDLDEPRLGRVTFHAQPNVWVHALADHVVTFAALPLGADRTLVRTTWLVHEEAEEGVDYDVESLTEVWRHTNEEDAVFVGLTQRGVADPAYEPGPYTEPERQVDAFVTWYVDRMREEASR
ncbi:aromatic ring-hydroxylating dioxygenase subunit alpha [Phycicoccus sp. CSK15P-2]|uniref:aromatic ring-hydroxylating oxygenase subunit alpha n=1 Tax=Phycicoccus sp. CSK15P-2 TaxID=2807627 RepID=UPI00194DCB87|nr:aromatic ring-hydroxylating dioxygenase subunit alpha [Phycicoccus sp. CSK15P-2]MBM6405682.1 aromatic ring-hydroxylating dioxygenase subunit alpha [Phycicoccus sp. CSK15P-2]